MNSRKSSALSTYSHVSEGVLWGPFCEVCMHDCYRIGGFSRDFKVFHHYQNQGVPYTLSQLEAKNGCESPFTNRDVKNGVASPPCSSPICKVKPQLVSLTFECGTQTSIETKNQKINTENHEEKSCDTQTAEAVDAVRLGNQEKVFVTQTFASIPQNQQTQTAPQVLTVVPTQSIDLVVEKQKLVVAPLVHTTTIPFFKASQQIMDPIEDVQLLSMGPKWRNAVAKHLVELRQILKPMNIQVEQCIICKLAFKDAISMLGHAVSAQHLGSVSKKGYSFSQSNDIDRLEELLGKIKVPEITKSRRTRRNEKTETTQSVERKSVETPMVQPTAVEVKNPAPAVSVARPPKIPFAFSIPKVVDPIETPELMRRVKGWRSRINNCKRELSITMDQENHKIVRCALCEKDHITAFSMLDHALSINHLNKLLEKGLKFSLRFDCDRLEDILTRAEAIKGNPTVTTEILNSQIIRKIPDLMSASCSSLSLTELNSLNVVVKEVQSKANTTDFPFLNGRTRISDAIPGAQLDSVLDALEDEWWNIGSKKINAGKIRIPFCNVCAVSVSSQFSALEHILSHKHIDKVKSTGRVFSISQDQNGLHEYFKSCRERSPSVPKEEAQKDQIPAKSTDNKTDTTPKTSDPSVKDLYYHQNSVPDQGICNVTLPEPHYDRLPEKIAEFKLADIPKKNVSCQPTPLSENNMNSASMVPTAEAQSENIKVESKENKTADISIGSATVLKELSSYLNSVPDQVVSKAPPVTVVEAQHGNALAKFVKNQTTETVNTAEAAIKDHTQVDSQEASHAAAKDLSSTQTIQPVQPLYNAIPIIQCSGPAKSVPLPRPELPQSAPAIKPQAVAVSVISVPPPTPDHFKLPTQTSHFQSNSFKVNDPRVRMAPPDSQPLSIKELRDLASAIILADPMKDICKYAKIFTGCLPDCQKCQIKLECPCALFNHIFSERHIATVKKISRCEVQGWLDLASSSVFEAQENGILCDGFNQTIVWRGIPFNAATRTGDRKCLTADPKCVIS